MRPSIPPLLRLLATFRSLPVVLLLALPMLVVATSVAAQETVIPKENIRTGYARVLRVEPVYQTLTATRMEQRCDGRTVPPEDPSAGGLSRIVGAVKDAFTPETGAVAKPAASDDKDCQLVPVQREFRRPIAFDVDYVYKGMKYRSRLPHDPGNRLRVRVSITPYVPEAR